MPPKPSFQEAVQNLKPAQKKFIKNLDAFFKKTMTAKEVKKFLNSNKVLFDSTYPIPKDNADLNRNNPNKPYYNGNLLEYLIAFHTPDELLEECLSKNPSKKAFLNYESEIGTTPLIFAAFNKRISALKVLLTDPDISVDQPSTKNGMTALHAAVIAENIEAVKLLLNHTPTPNIDMIDATGETALHYAAQKNSSEVTKLLLEYKADADIKNKQDETPLHLAVISQNIEVVKLLLANKANPHLQNLKGLTPLHYTANIKDLACAQCLLEHQADVNLEDIDGRISLHHAIEHQNVPLVKMLLDNGSDINLETNQNNLSAVAQAQLYAALYRTDNSREILKIIEATKKYQDSTNSISDEQTSSPNLQEELEKSVAQNADAPSGFDGLAGLCNKMDKTGETVAVESPVFDISRDKNAEENKNPLSPIKSSLQQLRNVENCTNTNNQEEGTKKPDLKVANNTLSCMCYMYLNFLACLHETALSLQKTSNPFRNSNENTDYQEEDSDNETNSANQIKNNNI